MISHRPLFLSLFLAVAAVVAGACKTHSTDQDTTIVEGTCAIAAGDTSVEYQRTLACTADFEALASDPIDATIPGARSTKVILDQASANAIWFQNSVKYRVHYDFASTHLSGNGLPLVGSLSEFNTTEYFSPDRRFLLGTVTHYDAANVWALEIAPYDTASAKMIETLFRAVKSAAFFGPGLTFHPTSDAVAVAAKNLPADIPIKTTDEIYAGIDYQPLSLGTGVGRLRFFNASQLETAEISYQDLLVLDQVPNDISVVQGVISQEFQTPLSHVNVLSQNRHTPNMGLRRALTNTTLRALEGKLVQLTVTSSSWTIKEVSQDEATAFWAAHKPTPVTLPAVDTTVTGLVNVEDATPEPTTSTGLRDAIKKSVLAFGGKAAHYSILKRTTNVPVQPAFVVPVYYYDQFMKQNGFYTQVDTLLADSTFTTDSAVRATKLTALRDAISAAPLDADLQALLKAKIAAEYANHKMRFRTSTNSEDLDGFPCAGCYDSHSGDPAKFDEVVSAIRDSFATVWKFRTFEERSYYGVDHKSVGMALLVHKNFPDATETANGVAATNNPYDPSGLEPALYVNVQLGGTVEVVAPPPGISSDVFLYFFGQPNQPITYLAHSSLVGSGNTVLTTTQVHALGVALDAIHTRFSPAYGPASGNTGWYAMDVEFKFSTEEDPTGAPKLFIKQARPYPGRGQ